MRGLKRLAACLIVTGAAALTSADAAFSYLGAWSAATVYRGDYTIGTGDTVQYGEINGKKLYWWAKWYATGTGATPGQFAAEGGTSPWVLINSASFDPLDRSKVYTWKGWNGQMASSLAANQADIPTWRDGAEGAYSIIHDDIGAMDWNANVQPGWDVDKLHPNVKVSWGVYVEPTDETEWAGMRGMVAEGHEMVNHSMNHTSAADQWSQIYAGATVPTSLQDPSVPKTVGGLTVVGFTPPSAPSGAENDRVTIENELISLTFTANWSGNCPKDPTQVANVPAMTIVPKAGTVTVTLPSGQKQYVRYDVMDTVNGTSTGKICAYGITWLDADPAVGQLPAGYVVPAYYQADGGLNWFMMKLYKLAKWAPADYKVQISDSRDVIDENVYGQFSNFGQWFPADMHLQYFVYPFDAYSETTHDSLMNNGYAAARGGAKSGKPLPGDFFHPNRIDFDAFYMLDEFHNTLYPTNPHSLLTLSGMLDTIVKYKGYMIRELHAVCKPEVTWQNINDASTGGWWGGITSSLYDSHLTAVDAAVTANKICTFTASEAVRYRMTANAATTATLVNNGANYSLTVATKEDILAKYRDEISVVVKLAAPATTLNVTYGAGQPRRAPRKLDAEGTAWSVNVNPWNGVATLTPGVPFDTIPAQLTAVKGAFAAKSSSLMAARMSGSVLNLTIPTNGCRVQLFGANGRMVRTENFAAGTAHVQMPVSDLAAGAYMVRFVSPKGLAGAASFIKN